MGAECKDEINFKKIKNLVFIPLNKFVDNGTITYDIVYTFYSPCSTIRGGTKISKRGLVDTSSILTDISDFNYTRSEDELLPSHVSHNLDTARLTVQSSSHDNSFSFPGDGIVDQPLLMPQSRLGFQSDVSSPVARHTQVQVNLHPPLQVRISNPSVAPSSILHITASQSLANGFISKGQESMHGQKL